MWGPTADGGGEEGGRQRKVAKRQRESGMEQRRRRKKRENVSLGARQAHTVYIIHFVLFCPWHPGKCFVTLGKNTHTHKLQTLFFSPFPLLYSRTPVWKCPVLDLNMSECLYLIQSVWKVSVCCRLCCLTSHQPCDTLQTGIKVWPKVAETVTVATYSLTPDKWTVYIKIYGEATLLTKKHLRRLCETWSLPCVHVITTPSCYIFIYHNPTVLIYILGRENASLHIIKSGVKRWARSWKWGVKQQIFKPPTRPIKTLKQANWNKDLV